MRVYDTIKQKLITALSPIYLSLIDESHRHHGHAKMGPHPHGESHFRLVIVSERFNGLQKVTRQRMVYDLLERELHDRIHALSMKTLTPDEANSLATHSHTSHTTCV